MFKDTIDFIHNLYPGRDFVPLHEPIFQGNEKQYVVNAIDSTFVSSVGQYVDEFERRAANYMKTEKTVVTGNGTAALHAAMHLLGVGPGDEVVTQALTFVATANAIRYCGAEPVFLDSDPVNLGLSAQALESFFSEGTHQKDGKCINTKTGRTIKVCVPMHVFGHPVRIDEIVRICAIHNVAVLEDAAESFGSLYKGQHTGLFGAVGVFSFNGNKIITAGGGGLIVARDSAIIKRAKHITTTAKVPHKWEFIHDELGFNYRMPNLNAALICGQLERIEEFVENKRQTAALYEDFFRSRGIRFLREPEGARSNYWLNAIFLESRAERDRFLETTNSSGVMTRPVWELMPRLKMFANCQHDSLDVAADIADKLVNLPSSVRKM